MRICLASIHPRLLSGQIESLIALANGLEALGHTVRVVSAFPQEQLAHQRRWELDRGDGLALAPKVVRIGRIVGAIAAAARDYDLLHFNVPTPAFGGLADVVRLLAGRPLVVGFEAHLADVPGATRRLRQAPEFYLPRIVVNNGVVSRFTLRRGRAYIVSSEVQRRELLALGYPQGRVRVIPNLVDDSKLRRWPKDEARRALGLPDGPLVAFVGHYHDVKGHDLLIEAFPRIRARHPQARLAIAWSGIGSEARVDSAIARLGIGPQVIKLGRVDVAQLFSAADVVALPYRFTLGQAAYPGTVIEAMWVGVPLVTSDLPLLAELSDQGETMLLARPGDAADLAEKTSRLLHDPQLAAQLVAEQRLAVERRFDSRRLVAEYAGLYSRALGRAQSVPSPRMG
jgi:glycosyltransferase involved in cell wall biosynthesis